MALKKRQPPVWINAHKWCNDPNQTYVFIPYMYTNGEFVEVQGVRVEFTGTYTDAIVHLCSIVKKDIQGYDEWRLYRKMKGEKLYCYFTSGKAWR